MPWAVAPAPVFSVRPGTCPPDPTPHMPALRKGAGGEGGALGGPQHKALHTRWARHIAAKRTRGDVPPRKGDGLPPNQSPNTEWKWRATAVYCDSKQRPPRTKGLREGTAPQKKARGNAQKERNGRVIAFAEEDLAADAPNAPFKQRGLAPPPPPCPYAPPPVLFP